MFTLFILVDRSFSVGCVRLYIFTEELLNPFDKNDNMSEQKRHCARKIFLQSCQ